MNRTLLACLTLAALSAADRAVAQPVVVLGRHLAAADAPRAQREAEREAQRAQADAWRDATEEISREMRASMGTLYFSRIGAGKVVKGAPYSADVVTETTQPLADGNVIQHRSTGRVARDGEGRTRQETDAEGGGGNVYISDPVAGKHMMLIPGAKRAVVTAAPAPRVMSFTDRDENLQVVRVDGKEIRVENGRVTIDGEEVPAGRVEQLAKSGKRIVVQDGKVTIDGKEVGDGARNGRNVVVNTIEMGDGVRREEVRIHVVRPAEAPMPPAPPMPPEAPGRGPALAPLPPVPPLPPIPGVQTMRFESTAHLGKGVTTSLGEKSFEGVKAEGKSTVWTIPAGKIGNRNPIAVTQESWYAPELQVTVYSRHSDPRTGETVYRLAGIRRAEPPAALFRVPADYRVRDRSERHRDDDRATAPKASR